MGFVPQGLIAKTIADGIEAWVGAYGVEKLVANIQGRQDLLPRIMAEFGDKIDKIPVVVRPAVASAVRDDEAAKALCRLVLDNLWGRSDAWRELLQLDMGWWFDHLRRACKQMAARFTA